MDINNSLSEKLLSPEEHAARSDDMMLPPGWIKLRDGQITYYANASLHAFQCTHPSLNAPPFQLDKTDYITGLPATDAPAWHWMRYLWWREVKSTHSVLGTLCALSHRFGWKRLSPPRDMVFQSRLWFRIWYFLSSLTSSFSLHTTVFMLLGSSILKQDFFNGAKPDQCYAAAEQSSQKSWIPYVSQFLLVSIPFSIYRCKFVSNFTLHISCLGPHQVHNFSRFPNVRRA